MTTCVDESKDNERNQNTVDSLYSLLLSARYFYAGVERLPAKLAHVGARRGIMQKHQSNRWHAEVEELKSVSRDSSSGNQAGHGNRSSRRGTYIMQSKSHTRHERLVIWAVIQECASIFIASPDRRACFVKPHRNALIDT